MYSNWRNKEFKDINMKNESNFGTETVKINIIENDVNNHAKKPKGWGHWNSFLKSDEYAKLIPCNDEITEQELSKHKVPGDLWIGLMYEKRICVFDVTLFAEYHPGGYDIIKSVAGRDATEDFRIAHAYVNPSMISRFKKGYLVRAEFKSPNTLSPGMSMLAPVRKPQPTKKPKWDWSEAEGIVVLKFNLHRILIQKLNCVSVYCSEDNIFKLRIFFDIEYYFFEIKLNDYLTPILNSLACDDQGKSISINLKSTLGYPISNLGGVLDDVIMSITDSVNKEEFLQCNLVKTRDLNHNCREFTIQWPDCARIGVPLGHHVIIQNIIHGESVQRPYTPVCEISPNHAVLASQKTFTLMVKRYNDGVISSFLHSLDEDSSIMVSFPTGCFQSPSWINVDSSMKKDLVKSNVESIVFIAAGSGITPMIRILLNSLQTGKTCYLLFFNRTQSDIIYINEFDALTQFYSEKFNVSYILSQPDVKWSGHRGRISNSNVHEILGDNLSNHFYLICGPTDFNKISVKIIQDLHDIHRIFEFKG